MLDNDLENPYSKFDAELPDSAAAFMDNCEGTYNNCEEAQTMIGGAVGFIER